MAKQKRPTDVVGNAVHVARALVEKMDCDVEPEKVFLAKTMPSGKVRSGKAGAEARNTSLTKEERSEIAKKAALKRWSKFHSERGK